MSAPYFNRQRDVALRAEIESWLGTPFLHTGRVKGVGVDCVQLVGQLMLSAGVVDSYDFGFYPLDWAQHRERSIIIDYIEATARFSRLGAEAAPRFGDVVMFRIGRCVHHCGVIVSPVVFVHALARGRVCYGRLDDPTWRKRLDSFYRALAHPTPSDPQSAIHNPQSP
jgi:cell wall-associated NlpC family hydrolase